MPGGKNNISGADGNTFSAENQPKNRRKSTKFLTDLLKRSLKKKREIEIEGIDTVTGQKVKVKVPMPTKDVLVQALLRQAAKGNVIAIKEVFDRIEGKTMQALEITGEGGQPLQFAGTHKFIIEDYTNGTYTPEEPGT